MSVYAVRIKDSDEVRIVSAPSAAQARNHVASADALSADELVKYLAKGLKVEDATAPAKE